MKRNTNMTSVVAALLVGFLFAGPMASHAWAQSEHDKVTSALVQAFMPELSSSEYVKGRLGKELSTPGTRVYNAALNDLRARKGDLDATAKHIKQGKQYYIDNFGLKPLLAAPPPAAAQQAPKPIALNLSLATQLRDAPQLARNSSAVQKTLTNNGVSINSSGALVKGGTIIAAAGTWLIGQDGASIVAAGGGNIVAAGGGNIVGGGGGNIKR